jgi:hypothetical protein
VTPKRAVQGVDDVLVTGTGYTPDGTAKAYLKPVVVQEFTLMRAIAEPFAAVAQPGEFLKSVPVDGDGGGRVLRHLVAARPGQLRRDGDR